MMEGILRNHAPVFLQAMATTCVAHTLDLEHFHPSTFHTLRELAEHRETGMCTWHIRSGGLQVGNDHVVVDLACKDAAGVFYSGDHRSRQSVEVKFGDFLDYYHASFAGKDHWLRSIPDLEFYLCQCPIAVLKEDETCSQPTLPCAMGLFSLPKVSESAALTQVNLWMSVHASRTTLHYDAYRNILVVLYGKKTVKLYPPSASYTLQARPVYAKSSNHSELPMDDARTPLPDDVPFELFSLNAGDALYIPEGWWHQVDSDPFTIAVNFWYEGLRETLLEDKRMMPYYARVLVEELVKDEAMRALQQLRDGFTRACITSNPTAADVVRLATQTNQEEALMGLSDCDLVAIQVALANEFPCAWQQLLNSASVEFAAVLVTLWDQISDSTNADRVACIFSSLDEEGDAIKQSLLAKHEIFQHKIYETVSQQVFGSTQQQPHKRGL